MIKYQVEQTLPLGELQDLWIAASFTNGMPEAQWEQLDRLIENSTFSVTARESGTLIGLVRILTDYIDLCQIADILVAETHQRQGVGTELLSRAIERLDSGTGIFVHAADDAKPFYERFGFARSDDVFRLDRH